jgi:hypothetical protein
MFALLTTRAHTHHVLSLSIDSRIFHFSSTKMQLADLTEAHSACYKWLQEDTISTPNLKLRKMAPYLVV